MRIENKWLRDWICEKFETTFFHINFHIEFSLIMLNGFLNEIGNVQIN